MRQSIAQAAPANGIPWWRRERRLVVTVILLGLAIGAVGSLSFCPTDADLDGPGQYHTAS